MKTCIFCGKHPESKNKEHIIPQWLIKMTGDPKRKINLGADMRLLAKTGEKKLISYSFNAFTFPACEVCNYEFSHLEGLVKAIIEKIFSKDYLSAFEIDKLLDWFDKVRIGLWLGNLKLENIEEYIDPAFYIKQRIGKRDRALFIYEMNSNVPQGINMVGTSSPGFKCIPSCFALRINNFYFYNLSFDFLFSYRIGFPYPKHFAVSSESARLFTLSYKAGTEKLKLPLLDFTLMKPGIAIYQPIIANETNKEDYHSFFMNDYVQNRLHDKYKGAIFYEETNFLQRLGLDDEIRLEGYQKLPALKAKEKIQTQVMRTVEKFLAEKHDLRNLDTKQRRIYEANMKLVLKAHRDFMNKNIVTLFDYSNLQKNVLKLILIISIILNKF